MSTRTEFRERRAQRRRQQRTTTALVIAGLVVLVGAVVLLPTLAPVGGIVMPDPYDYPSPADHAIGDPAAPVRIEEYSDFQCPFCSRFHSDTLPRIIDDYVRTGKVYFIYRHFPVVDSRSPAQESHTAATAAVCAGRQNRFWDYHDVLFANQRAENAGDFVERRLQAMAERLGLDMEAFNACYNSSDAQAAVTADAVLAVQSGLSSTPSFLVNGTPIIGAQPYEVFQQVIEAELAEG